MVVPGGWDGERSRGTLVYIIERKNDDAYSFVICNGGCAGIEYHPSAGAAPSIPESAGAKTESEPGSPSALPSAGSAPKLKFNTCIRIDIPGKRMP